MPRKSKGLFDAFNDLIGRKKKGGMKERTTSPQLTPIPKKQQIKAGAKDLQAKLNKVGTPKKVKRAKPDRI